MSCTYYSWKGGFFGDYWCNKKDCRVDSDTYRKYCRDYNYDECPIYKHTESSGCFITTLACQILGKCDNHPVLNNLRNFRDNVLQQDKKYEEVLKQYDCIGPMIADALNNDKDKIMLSLDLYNYSILPISKAIDDKNYDKAITHYQYMTLYLVNYYGLKDEYNNIKDNNYNYETFNQETAGHGIKRVKTNI